MTQQQLWKRCRALMISAPGVAAFVVLVVLMSLWSVITPLYGAPDEPAHVIRAASVVRGQLLGTKVRGTGDLQVTVPAFLAQADRDGCFAFRATVSASCMHLDGTPPGTRKLLTAAGRHPPVYYAIVGLPTLLAASDTGVWLMRIVSVLLCAALVALAVDTAARYLRGTLARIGLAIAVTPMVFFLTSVVNPNGLEVASAVATWVAAAAVVVQPGDRVDPGLLDRLGIATASLILCRQLGLLWVAVIAASVLLIGGLRPLVRMWRQRRGRAWLGALTVVAIAQLGWIFATGALNTENTNTAGVHLGVLDRFRDSFGVTYTRFLEMLGVFGWRDTPSPTATYFLWTLALGGIIAGLYLVGTRRALLTMALLGLAVVLIPPFFEVPAAPSVGYFWQGRYTLPIAIGIPILAGALIRPGSSQGLRRIGNALSVALGLGLLLAFLEFWRRNAVGTHGKIFFLSNPSWKPPLPAWIVLPAAIVVTAAWLWLVVIQPTRGASTAAASDRSRAARNELDDHAANSAW
jgi:Predicted membrane protein (DUF2142)